MKVPSEELQKRIVDTIKYRFYDRLDLYDVYKWLNNFQDNEQELAVSVFEKLEYYREEELLGILSSKLNEIVNDIHSDLKKSFHIRFVPLGKPGKSGHAIQYLMKNLLKGNTPKYIKAITYYSHPKDIDTQTLTDDDVIIFLDDIIGSGDTFVSAVKHTTTKYKNNGEPEDIPNEWTIGNIVKANATYKIILLSCFIMDIGKERLENDFPYIKLYGEIRIHAFCKNKSPFGGYLKMKQVREFCYKYGKILCPGNELGYSNTQALLLFAHAIPNNTLPIIWSDNYEENEVKKLWNPLIPRNQMKKQSLAFINRMNNNRWVFKLSQHFGVDLNNPEWKGLIQDKNLKLTYLLRCLEKNIPEVVIANDMGLTHTDMSILFEEGEKIGLWDNNHNVTIEAQKSLSDAFKMFKIQEKYGKDVNIIDDRNYMYIPRAFQGKS